MGFRKPLVSILSFFYATGGLIKHHGITMDDIMGLPEVRGRGFSQLVINEFLDRQGLLKKTPPTEP